MLRLNDDCLSLIFDKLNLRDQISLTAVCERFRDIILAVQWRSRFRRLESNSEMDVLSPEEYESLLTLIVDRIEHLVITDRRVNTWHPDPTFTLHIEFPVLRVLEWNITSYCDKVSEADMELIAMHCPLIEKLYLIGCIEANLCPYIGRLRHLRVLHMPTTILDESYLQQILTSPLTELRVHSFLVRDRRSVAEMLIGASDLRVFQMNFYCETTELMKLIVDLASTTELRHPLTVNVIFDERYDVLYYNFYEECQRSLKALIDKQLPSSTVTILLSDLRIELRL